jgi:NADH-quinone oxidoreductase subunit M
MNFALIGLFSNSDFGVLGFIHTMLSHGIISTAMFYIIGYIYANLTFRDTIRLSGISTKMPKISFYFFIFSIANIGIPLFSGFPGEFFILISIANYNIVYSVILIVPFMLTGYYNFYQINKLLFNVGQSNMVEF